MDKLLEAVLDAHGGLHNWANVTSLTARLSLGGPFWGARGWPDVFDNEVVRAEAHHEHITFLPFTAPDRSSELKVGPETITIFAGAGNVVEQRVNPRATFPSFEDVTQWDAVQLAYFTSAAVWNYLIAPFVFAMPGVIAREIDPWTEDGETWRRLAVTFPATISNHNADQVFYYDEAFMQRRMDYSPDVTGNPPVAHYTYDPKTFDGFVFPTRRRVLLHDANGIADHSFAPITLDIADVTVERKSAASPLANNDSTTSRVRAEQLVDSGVSP